MTADNLTALPVPDAWLYEHWCDGPRKEVHFQRLDHLFYNLGGGYTKGVALYTEQQARALLAARDAEAWQAVLAVALEMQNWSWVDNADPSEVHEWAGKIIGAIPQHASTHGAPSSAPSNLAPVVAERDRLKVQLADTENLLADRHSEVSYWFKATRAANARAALAGHVPQGEPVAGWEVVIVGASGQTYRYLYLDEPPRDAFQPDAIIRPLYRAATPQEPTR